ncbi:protein kinase domain protein [Ichthyophthirius multifiliis]|uniref:Protein kinase domain protein n=1 Tax=Ichthyophthirius multifiliis TaxID=5932 RepID=G0QP45_ICHMU|nr:protein kinase domain protein [Ichthyophthirius multifiliis]EGR33011.1 protein kinase domain protein [Ichthyophthirius multifiliis]|eukprot:XP_004036997.1 protein kinase domain protein [Ichthyophthirius multifiliis]
MEQDLIQTSVGSPLYMCPQILNQQKYSSKCDVWSLGIIFFEMVYGKTPWKAANIYDLIIKINKEKLLYPQEPLISDQLKEIIGKMLELEEKNRIGWEQLFGLKIFQDIEEENKEEKQEQDEDFLKKTQNENKKYFNGKKQVLNSIYECENRKNKIKDNNYIIKEEEQQKQQQEMNFNNNEYLDDKTKEKYSQIFSQYNNIQETKKIIRKIGSWILHRRNKAVFLNNITVKLYDFYDNKVFMFDKIIFYKIMFVLSKYQTMIIYKINQRLKTKLLEKNNKFSQDEWKVFVKSNERGVLQNFVQKDLDVIKLFFEELLKKCSQFFQCQIKECFDEKDKDNLQNILSICNKQIEDKNKFDVIYDLNVNEFFSYLKSFIEQNGLFNNLEVLQFLMHVKNAVKIKEFFKYKTEPKFDFMKYYETVQKMDCNKIIKNLFKS